MQINIDINDYKDRDSQIRLLADLLVDAHSKVHLRVNPDAKLTAGFAAGPVYLSWILDRKERNHLSAVLRGAVVDSAGTSDELVRRARARVLDNA